MTAASGKGNKGAGKVTSAGAVEINEDGLDQVAGGAAVDYLLEIDGIKGESSDRKGQMTAGYDLKTAKKV